MSTVQSHRAHVLNLCFAVQEACSLTDIQSLKPVAEMILEEMGHVVPQKKAPVSENCEDLL